MNSSISGIISAEFVNVSDSFSDYTDISQSNHNRIVKAKRFGKWYVLKGLTPECVDKAIFIELLRKEFDLGISLDHPNIIRTIGKEQDTHIGDCIVIEYIDGVTLKEWLETKPSKNERRRVVMQLLTAMSYFHSKGIIHRDLKPDNILITRNGANVKVIDFGLSDSDEYAVLKQPAGSRKYAAQEQLTKDVAVDQRADIYAFGCILSEMALYNRIAQKASQQNPADRYSNAGEIIASITNRQKLRGICIVMIIVGLFVASIYGVYKNTVHNQNTTMLVASDTIVKTTLVVDTIVVMKEIPAVVEKVVLKDVGESDSAYLARKKREKEMVLKAEMEYKKLYSTTLQACENAKIYEDLDKVPLPSIFESAAKLKEMLLSEIDREENRDFYYSFSNIISKIIDDANQKIQIRSAALLPDYLVRQRSISKKEQAQAKETFIREKNEKIKADSIRVAKTSAQRRVEYSERKERERHRQDSLQKAHPVQVIRY